MTLLETLAAPETLPTICRAWFAAASDAGLDALGFAPVGPATTFELFADRVRRGACAGLPYLEENVDARRDPRSVLPSAQTLVVVALAERRLRAESTDATQTLAAELAQIAETAASTPETTETAQPPRSSGAVVPYAACLDYHDVLKRKLKRLRAFFLDRFPNADARAVVDTAPLLEKDWAVRAGIGFCGLHSLVVSPRLGSRLFLGELLVSTPFAETTGFASPEQLRAALAANGIADPASSAERCLRCRRCVDACPTGALPGDRTLLPQRCLNFWTIENRNALPDEIARNLDGRLFGCDLCQRVCPWNAPENNVAALDLPLAAVDALDDAEFRRLFKKTPIFRARLDGLKRIADALRAPQTRQNSENKEKGQEAENSPTLN